MAHFNLRQQLEDAEMRIRQFSAALEPFARPALLPAGNGQLQGDSSPVYGRGNTLLYLGDFRRAAALVDFRRLIDEPVARFLGEKLAITDGRRMVHPYPEPVYIGTPQKIKASMARASYNRFLSQGKSLHSPVGATVWVVVCLSLWNEVPFTISPSPIFPQGGWVVRVDKEMRDAQDG